MTDLLFKKVRSQKYLAVHTYAFLKARDHPNSKEEKELDYKIVKALMEKGYYLTDGSDYYNLKGKNESIQRSS